MTPYSRIFYLALDFLSLLDQKWCLKIIRTTFSETWRSSLSNEHEKFKVLSNLWRILAGRFWCSSGVTMSCNATFVTECRYCLSRFVDHCFLSPCRGYHHRRVSSLFCTSAHEKLRHFRRSCILPSESLCKNHPFDLVDRITDDKDSKKMSHWKDLLFNPSSTDRRHAAEMSYSYHEMTHVLEPGSVLSVGGWSMTDYSSTTKITSAVLQTAQHKRQPRSLY